MWANSPWSDAYASLRDAQVGPAALHLHLSLGTWAADGLLAIFFFVAGLELKREFVAGDLRDPRRAALPVAAAVGGVVRPALVYVAGQRSPTTATLRGWAIPTATDIAFALAVLAVIGRNLPVALRTFLLTLAVVDDLLAITIIAVFYTDDLAIVLLLLGAAAARGVRGARPAAGARLVAAAAAGAASPGRWSTPPACTPPSPASCSPSPCRWSAATRPAVPTPDRDWPSTSSTASARCRPALPCRSSRCCRPASPSAGLPACATRSATRSRSASSPGWSSARPSASPARPGWSPASPGAQLDEDLAWPDVVGLSLLAGIGFTVSLLIGELAFGTGSTRDEHVKIAVLAGSLLAIVLAAIVLRARSRARS